MTASKEELQMRGGILDSMNLFKEHDSFTCVEAGAVSFRERQGSYSIMEDDDKMVTYQVSAFSDCPENGDHRKTIFRKASFRVYKEVCTSAAAGVDDMLVFKLYAAKFVKWVAFAFIVKAAK